ncbi:MAG: hypothetical protein DYG94_09095 [Leptolyngbya sp. PLA3]|nr:MAG: hypothetical protein EDM82_02700 [Cyanobacteria bacterium CYA]MCE7968887.1 hypothetical protein [Leptolyngbya sp. PL-A3]
MPPNVLTAPYDTLAGEVLWAVVPPVNESGTSLVDPLAVGDAVVAAVTEIQGVAALPVNRTLAAMRGTGVERVVTPEQVRQLAEAMGVDGVVVTSITAWDPYDPPVIGITLALYARSGPMRAQAPVELDPKALASAASDADFLARSSFGSGPVAVSVEHLDARNHQTQMYVREFAQGRSDSASALNWRIYFASMELYTQFAAYHGVRRLLENEWMRTARAPAQ